ncbi:HSF-type DNA-binding-domain-containing protein [Cunninghamella echinulata]|nr:HSF-type DNA-binding-domain-containing protein [Cunninghamella echinulata]
MKESTLTVSNDKRLPAFIKKLWIIVNDEKLDHIIYWSNDNNAICISDSTVFSEVILPKYFKHNNWHSFVRQLNLDYANGRQETVWQFKHPYFKKKNTLNDLLLIRRKTSKLNPTATTVTSTSTSSASSSTSPSSLPSSSLSISTNKNVKGKEEESIAMDPSSSYSPSSTSPHSMTSGNNNNNSSEYHEKIISKIEKQLEETQRQYEVIKIETQWLKDQQVQHQKLIQQLLQYVSTKEGELRALNQNSSFNNNNNNNNNNKPSSSNSLPPIASIISFATRE